MRAILLSALALTIAACGSSTKPIVKPTTRAAGARVEMRHNRFTPHRIVVRVGTFVRWTNHDAVAHTVASQQLRLSSEGIEPGATFDFRPAKAGRFAYYCTIHAGQTGVLIVR